MSSYLIGIDFGTGSGKAAVVDDTLKVVGYVACRVVKSAVTQRQ